MNKIHTHYDNLKVTRDAPPEVVRAAYQALTRKYHPDRNQGDLNAQRVMTLINAAYDVLSDPQKREQHDRWIRSMESEAPPTPHVEFPQGSAPTKPTYTPSPAPPAPPPAAARAPSPPPAATPSVPPTQPNFTPSPRVGAAAPIEPARPWWLSYAVAGLLVIGVIALLIPWRGGSNEPMAKAVTPQEPLAVPVAAEVSDSGGYARPARTPTGEPWPAASGYVPGFKELFNDGLSTVTVDNASNPSDVYVKLYAVREPRSFAVRWVFVRAGDKFAITHLRAGRYDLRYRDLDTGLVTRTEPFDLKESTVAEGTRFTQVKLSLQKAVPRERTTTARYEADF